jgi:hypothetical protein
MPGKSSRSRSKSKSKSNNRSRYRNSSRSKSSNRSRSKSRSNKRSRYRSRSKSRSINRSRSRSRSKKKGCQKGGSDIKFINVYENVHKNTINVVKVGTGTIETLKVGDTYTSKVTEEYYNDGGGGGKMKKTFKITIGKATHDGKAINLTDSNMKTKNIPTSGRSKTTEQKSYEKIGLSSQRPTDPKQLDWTDFKKKYIKQ